MTALRIKVKICPHDVSFYFNRKHRLTIRVSLNQRISTVYARDYLDNVNKVNKTSLSKETDYKNSVVFNADDGALCNGYVTHITIESDVPCDNEKLDDITLYVIARTTRTNSFQIVQCYSSLSKVTGSDNDKQTFHLKDQTVYLEQDQLLAIDFGSNCAEPKRATNGSHYALDRNIVNEGYKNNTTVKFTEYNSYISINFDFVPTSGKSI